MKMMVGRSESGLHVRLGESLGIADVREAKEKIGPVLEMGGDLVFELAGLEEIDTAGVQLLFAVKRECDRKGAGCQFVHPDPRILSTLELFRLPGLQLDPVAA